MRPSARLLPSQCGNQRLWGAFPAAIRAQGKEEKKRPEANGIDRHAGKTQQQRGSHGTVLFVDGGFPIDVVFYASVWGGERKRGESSRVREPVVMASLLQPFSQQQSIPGLRSSRKDLAPHEQPMPRHHTSARPGPAQTDAHRKGTEGADGPSRKHSLPQEGETVSLLPAGLWGKLKHMPVRRCANPPAHF